MADQEGRDVALLGDLDEGGRDLAYLCDSSWHAFDGGRADRLDRVDYQEAGLDLVDVGQQRREVGLGGAVERVVPRSRTVGAQANLCRGLLTGDVQRAH